LLPNKVWLNEFRLVQVWVGRVFSAHHYYISALTVSGWRVPGLCKD
jgi:hypothetical protein